MSRMSRAVALARPRTVESVTTSSVAPERTLVALESAVAAPEQSPAAPEQNPAAPEQNPAAPEQNPAVPERDSVASGRDSTAPDRDSVADGHDGSAGEPACYKHATAQALARGGATGHLPTPRRPNGGDHRVLGRRTLEGQSPRFGPAAEESDHRTMVSVDRESSIRRLVRRLVASEAELDAEELQRGAVASGCCPVDEAGRGDLVSISGRLRTVVYTPRTTLPTLEAELYDGSDVVTLVWLGRRHIAGIEPGRQLTIRGRVATRDDRKVVYNPYYELEPPR